MPTDPTRPRRALDASGQLVAHPETKIARVPTGSAAPRAELGRACCPILIPRGGPRPWGSYQRSAPGLVSAGSHLQPGPRCTAGDRCEPLDSDGVWTNVDQVTRQSDAR